MKNLNLRSDFITISDFQNESEYNRCYYYASKWQSIQQISSIFFLFYTFLSALLVEQIILTVFSL